MKTKYIINNNKMIISIDYLYELEEKMNNIQNIRKQVNRIIKENNISFYGNKIIIYINNLLIGTFYLVNFYLNQINKKQKKKFLTSENSYFYEETILEIGFKKKTKFHNILLY